MGKERMGSLDPSRELQIGGSSYTENPRKGWWWEMSPESVSGPEPKGLGVMQRIWDLPRKH